MVKKHYLVSSFQEFEELLRHHEVESYNTYTICKTNGPFKGKGNVPQRKPRVHWGLLAKIAPKLASTPYLIVATCYYVCHLGKCYYSSKLKMNMNAKDDKSHQKKAANSKKVGCPAGFKVQRLIVFTENMLLQDTPTDRARMGTYIRRNISTISFEHKYLFKFPEDDEHQNHLNQKSREPIDKRVINKIRELVNDGRTGILSVSEMLDKFVELEIKVRDKKRRRFFPSRVDIQRMIHKAKLNLRKERNDQSKLLTMKQVLGQVDEIYFQPSGKVSDSGFLCSEEPDLVLRNTGFLFFVQTQEMKEIYAMYGQQGIILDPTYRFCLFSFPLYSVAVQTNVCYQIVAMFITESETKEAIIDALNILIHWNPTIFPAYALTDNNPQEFKALEHVFPGIKVFTASFYRESSWKQRLLLRDIKVSQRNEFEDKFQAIAYAVSEEHTRKAVNELKMAADTILMEFFDKSWLKEIKRWAIIYRPPDMLLEMNEAIDKLDEVFKYVALSKMKDVTLSQMIYHLCKYFIPQTLQEYWLLNRSPSTEMYIPPYLANLPHWIFKAIWNQIELADQDLSYSSIEYLSEACYSLVCKKSKVKYKVKFDIEHKLVTCTCFYFLKRRVICKHAIIVGRFNPMWSIEKISLWLFDRLIFKVEPSSQILTSLAFKSSQQEGIRKEQNELSRPLDNSSPMNKQTMAKCHQSIKSLGSLVNHLTSSQLENFEHSLREFCSEWFTLIDRNELEIGAETDDIPSHFLQKLPDMYGKSKKECGPGTRKKKKLASNFCQLSSGREESESVRNSVDYPDDEGLVIIYINNLEKHGGI